MTRKVDVSTQVGEKPFDDSQASDCRPTPTMAGCLWLVPMMAGGLVRVHQRSPIQAPVQTNFFFATFQKLGVWWMLQGLDVTAALRNQL